MASRIFIFVVALAVIIPARWIEANELGKIQLKTFADIGEPIPFPNPNLTQGRLFGDRIAHVCDADFRTSTIRADTQAMKCEVFVAYGIQCRPCVSSATTACGEYEIDHWLPLTDGGSDGSETTAHITSNLWPQPGYRKPYIYTLPDGTTGHWGARRKDVVENEIHRALCNGRLLAGGVSAAMADWPHIYLRKTRGEPTDWSAYHAQ